MVVANVLAAAGRGWGLRAPCVLAARHSHPQRTGPLGHPRGRPLTVPFTLRPGGTVPRVSRPSGGEPDLSLGSGLPSCSSPQTAERALAWLRGSGFICLSPTAWSALSCQWRFLDSLLLLIMFCCVGLSQGKRWAVATLETCSCRIKVLGAEIV